MGTQKMERKKYKVFALEMPKLSPTKRGKGQKM